MKFHEIDDDHDDHEHDHDHDDQDDDYNDDDDDDRRLGVENGAERRPPPGIQAQRPSPSHRTHRTHDTTDQWRDDIWWLPRT